MEKANELKGKITYKDQEYDLVFNLNVMKNIQKRFGTFDNWVELTSGENSETDIDAFIFGICEMINEGIDIKNEEQGTDIPFISEKKAGRIITEYGMEEATSLMKETVVEATKDDEPKNS